MTGRSAVWTVPAHLPFLDTLVAGLFERYGRDPLALAEILVILPTRRAGRSLTEAFLRASEGRPLLLPRMTALGDLDADEFDLAGLSLDIPPAIDPLRRQLLLARLIRQWRAGDVLPAQAVALAADLARLLDQAHTERVSLDRLEELVPPELAEHWRITVEFLTILRDHWPAIVGATGLLDPAERRDRLVEAQVELWRTHPPQTPVVAAGFGSAIPAGADLLAAVASLPRGAVVVPGLDTQADDELWTAVKGDPTHPQNGLAMLLDRLEIGRAEIPEWAGDGVSTPRLALVREIMRPAAVSHRWRGLDRVRPEALDNLTRLDLAGPHEEAGTIALLLRDRLEVPGATAMLVTADRGLARRVAAELKRWHVDIDDSAGVPLNQTAPGVFLRLLADAALEALAPVPLLALLKHPLTAPAFREPARLLERACLRGPRPAPGLAGLRAVASGNDEGAALVERLASALSAFLTLVGTPEVRLETALAAHIRAAEALAGIDGEDGAARLWALEAGEALADFVAELAAAAPELDAIRGTDYPVLFEATMAGRVVRPPWGKHPRLQILGTLEARLQSADLVILGGLNEGSWPPQAAQDPFMSRPMRQSFGLASPEAQIGVAAHDFMIGISAPEIVLTRSLRVEGAPTVPSRWLLRLDTVLRAAGIRPDQIGGRSYHAFPDWQAQIDRPAAVRAAEPPSPRPPVSARPRKLPVTAIETWMRDPYAIYAGRILRLSALEPLDADPGVAERGMFIHQALDEFVRTYPAALPADALDRLEALGRAAFGTALERPGVWAFWWPRFRRIAGWFVEHETERRPLLAESLAETHGEVNVDGITLPFLLHAKADRIDRLAAGGLVIIDYKTGSPPSKDEVRLGFAPQLPLEAAIAMAGGFTGVDADEPAGLAFWRLSGGDPAGQECPLDDPAALAAAASAGLERLIRSFDDPSTPYRARPQPTYAPRYSDYAHLARLQEWGAGDFE